ncbi:hypothetical protein DOK79_000888 [Enterococcus sp. DIV1094]|uniref:Uncharacterized protein n=1 Tax=Candidatus Enterococcus mangumiae TaxID=2230878 RepID=A0ABZ2SW53_9ENTE
MGILGIIIAVIGFVLAVGFTVLIIRMVKQYFFK